MVLSPPDFNTANKEIFESAEMKTIWNNCADYIEQHSDTKQILKKKQTEAEVVPSSSLVEIEVDVKVEVEGKDGVEVEGS